jgi:hypothetical protein
MMMKHTARSMILGATVCLGDVTFSQVAMAQAAQPIAGAVTGSELTGEVTVVNTQTRLMTIKTPSGVFEVLNVPDSIEGIDDIDIGDEVTITSSETVLVGLEKGTGEKTMGETTVAPAGAVATRTVEPVPGEPMAASVVDDVTVFGTVTKVNQDASTLTVQGADGPMQFKVKDPILLDQVAAGDAITAHYVRVVTGEIKD